MSNKLYADKLIYGWSWPEPPPPSSPLPPSRSTSTPVIRAKYPAGLHHSHQGNVQDLDPAITLFPSDRLRLCNFLPLPPLLSQGADTNPTLGHSDAPTQITYRTYATLSFILISTSTESPLALIDLIQVFVEALDRLFENVCELDLIFGFETMHAVLAEMIVGGVVIETNLDRIVQGVRSQEGSKGRRKAVEAASSGIGRTGIPGLGVPWR
ncbi:AP-3 complex subunit sigma [Coccidioides immitis RMSCC 3703]|uniref:AP-3 complex subunit sigma n=1 Tax=Coccidioides immitis RMSCC 3703 TaxID=454286 RepID=A0A0J8TRI1_COCIT|nr:AP-3 complex subunit sigma [Coccidioides immitis RMSCC 3703]